MLRLPIIGLTVLSIVLPSASAADPKQIEFFENKIRPVLVEQCYGCHSQKAEQAGKLRGGLKLDSKAALLKGGESGVALVPGKPDDGLFLKSLKYDGELQMPPKGKLPEKVIQDFEKWIKDGAVDPRETVVVAASPAMDIEKGRKLWSLQPPKPQSVPVISDPLAEIRSPIDSFIQAKWLENGLTPSSIADKRTLIRRVTYDLTGLPPTPEEVEAFVQDSSPKAWQKLIDRLLASPRYGERWGRHWLDVARYAQDQAHTFQVTPKPNAYLYRDWVIQAFNSDMPFDEFVRLQIAGDLINKPKMDKFTQYTGLGFMGLGAEYYKNTAKEQAIAEELDDRVDTLTRGFLGLTVACARCHDHKFDPIPTQDYYALAGIYNGTSMKNVPLVSEEVVNAYNQAQEKIKAAEAKVNDYLGTVGVSVLKDTVKQTAKYLQAAWKIQHQKAKIDEVIKQDGLKKYFLDRWMKYLDSAKKDKMPKELKEWYELKSTADAKEVGKMAESVQDKLVALEIPNLAALKTAKSKSKKPLDSLVMAMFVDTKGPLFLSTEDVEKQFLSADAKKQLSERKSEVKKQTDASPPMPLAAHVIAGDGQEMQVYIRGNPATKGDAAPKGFLRVISTDATPDEDFTRLDLANAIASPKNPLTARVIVNRVWAWHFGLGIVNTPSNFGTLGGRPSHPELLDYLTTEFVKNGWSIKWLHRAILNTTMYQLGNDVTSENLKIDPANVYRWTGNRRRLDIEAWRDSLLFVSGNLDEKVGGPAFNLKDASARRRTVYAKVSRHELDGLLRMFDFPDANVTADRRNSTTVPQQQLFTLNSEFMVNQATAFASRLEKLGNTNEEKIRAAYRLALDRVPESREIELAERFLKLPTKPEDKLTRWQQYAQAILASNEFMYVD